MPTFCKTIIFCFSYAVIGLFQCEQHAFYNSAVNRLATGSLTIYLVTDYPDIRTKLDPLLLPYVLKGYGLLVIAGICLTILCVDQVRGISFKLIDSHLRRI